MFARVENDTVVEMRDLVLEAIPEHKRYLWRPIVTETVGTPGPFTSRRKEQVIEAERVVQREVYERVALEVAKGYVKLEARRRIIARFPDWKQTNMVARGVELQNLFRLNGAWTEQEQAEAAALDAAWAWVKSVRMTSDALEQMDPIPDDYTADYRWPA